VPEVLPARAHPEIEIAGGIDVRRRRTKINRFVIAGVDPLDHLEELEHDDVDVDADFSELVADDGDPALAIAAPFLREQRETHGTAMRILEHAVCVAIDEPD